MKLEQQPRYQKDANVKEHKITPEYKSIDKILSLIPKGQVLDIACAEGFLVWLAEKRGHNAYGIEIDEGRVNRGRKNLNIPSLLTAGDIFNNLSKIKDYNIFIVARFFHNIGYEKSLQLMDEINKKDDYIIIVKYKPGLRKETGAPREPLATKKGVKNLLEQYNLKKKSFQQQVIVAAKGKYEGVPDMLRKHIGEG